MKKMMLMLAVCSTAACTAAPGDGLDDGVTADEQSIIGGTTDNGDPSVVAVHVYTPSKSVDYMCTGTVIGPHTVLTAAHCVSPVEAGQVVEIVSGTYFSWQPGIVASSTTFDPAFNINNLSAGHDIGIIHTTEALPFPSVAIGPVSFALPVRLVGYGYDNNQSNSGLGTKREVTTTIAWHDSVLFVGGNSNAQICHGDSGGPAFQTVGGRQILVGVSSFVDPLTAPLCFNGGWHVRVDSELGFITANTY